MHGSGGATAMTDLILKRAPVGSNLEDYSVLEHGAVVGRPNTMMHSRRRAPRRAAVALGPTLRPVV